MPVLQSAVESEDKRSKEEGALSQQVKYKEEARHFCYYVSHPFNSV